MRRLVLAGLFVVLACWVLPAQAAIAPNGSPTYTKCTTSPCTVSHTVAGVDPFLGVCVTWWHYLNTPAITAATWNGIPLSLVGISQNPACGDKCSAALYMLANPPAGTANTSITFSGSFNDATVGTFSFTGVDASLPVGTWIPSQGVGSPASVSVSSASGQVVVDCLGSYAAGSAPAMDSGQTLNWSHFDANAFTHSASSYRSGLPLTDMSWIISGSPQWAMLAMPIRPAGGGGGGGTTPGTQRVISWTDNSDNESCFHLQWRTDQSAPNWVDLSACLPANTVSYANNIGTQTGDCYRVEATNAGGSNGFTDQVCASDPTPPPLPPPTFGIASPFTFDIEEDLL